MRDPQIDGLESQSHLSNRARPGLKGMGVKTALILLLVSLLPLAGLPIFFGQAGDRLGEPLAELQSEREALAQQVSDRDATIARLQSEAATALHQQNLSRFSALHQTALSSLATTLTRLCSGKSAEDLAADEGIAKAIDQAPAMFEEVALIRLEDAHTLRTRKAKPGKGMAEALPELAEVWKKELPSPGPAEHWNWQKLGDSGLLLAVRSSPPAAPAPVPPPPAEGLLKSEAPARIAQIGQELRSAVLTMSIGLPLFAIALALIALWWFHAQLLSPVRKLSGAARLALDDLNSDPSDLLKGAGQLQDLADSVVRLRERHLRLRATDEAQDQRRQELVRIKAAVERAAAGKLGLRVPLTAGETEELALAINRLLESVSGWVDGLRGIGQQLVASSQRLTPVAARLAERIARDGGESTESGALADFLEVQIDGLCQTSAQLAEEFDRSAPPALTTADIEHHRTAMAGPGTGLKLLTERIAEVTTSSARLSGLRQDAEVLATNLAISAEANAPGQVEKLVSDARALARAVVDISGVLGKSLGQLSQTGEDMKAAFTKVNEQYVLVVRQLADWESLRRSVNGLSSDLTRQLSAVRPASRSLGADLRNLAQVSATQRKQQRDLSETLEAAGRSVTALSETTRELVDLLDKIDTGHPAPTAITQRLADQRKALEVAVRDLTDVAREEGIEALSQEAQDILASIRTLADSARERIRQEATPGAKVDPDDPADAAEADA